MELWNSDLGIRDEELGIRTPQSVVRMKLVGANPHSRVRGLEELPGKVNYFVGNDPKQWRTNIPIYAKVKYQNVYPGIDLIYHGHQSQLEYDFVVAAGMNPNVIELAFEGADHIEVDDRGDLVLHTGDGEVRLHKPDIYQAIHGTRQSILGCYVLRKIQNPKSESLRSSSEFGVRKSKIENRKSKRWRLGSKWVRMIGPNPS